MVVSLNYCSQNGGNVYRDPYYNGNPKRGPRIIGNLDRYPYTFSLPLLAKKMIPRSDPVFFTSGLPLGVWGSILFLAFWMENEH